MNARKVVAAGLAAATMAVAALPMGATAQSPWQNRKNNDRNVATGLGIAGAYELLHGNTGAGLLLGAGAAYEANQANNIRHKQDKRDNWRDGDYRYRRNDLSYDASAPAAGSMSAAPASTSLNAQSVNLIVNDQAIPSGGREGAMVLDGTTYVPLRVVAQQLGATVTFDPAKRAVTASRNGTSVCLPANDFATINGKRVSMDKPALMLNDGTTLVPLRFMAQAFGAGVSFDSADHAVRISERATA